MNSKDRASLDDAVFRNTAKDPTWLGYWVARHQQSENLDEPKVAERLGISMDKLVLLCLCRTPRDDHFREDIQMVCGHTGASDEALAHMLRQEKALSRWAKTAPLSDRGWLQAASDRLEEPSEPPSESPETPDDR